MDRGGCQMSGGGGGGGGGGNGMITLEDLESFTEEQLSDSGSLEEEGPGMEADGSDSMLQYWQEVARGHQVEVSQGMYNNLEENITLQLS